ncbi:uncharacterized protein LOC127722993 [Mytilus californianus]|uniref:uncharacterized protein LOC127722993 n=1 Tax=Mytilus californianus TaxID=6549 RepID=UPI002246915F|nr:uncharacterized protein LOC127722993 [Mytilus californianus]
MICLTNFVILTILTFTVYGQVTNSSAINRQYQNYEFPSNNDGKMRNPRSSHWTNNMQRRNETYLPQSRPTNYTDVYLSEAHQPDTQKQKLMTMYQGRGAWNSQNGQPGQSGQPGVRQVQNNNQHSNRNPQHGQPDHFGQPGGRQVQNTYQQNKWNSQQGQPLHGKENNGRQLQQFDPNSGTWSRRGQPGMDPTLNQYVDQSGRNPSQQQQHGGPPSRSQHYYPSTRNQFSQQQLLPTHLNNGGMGMNPGMVPAGNPLDSRMMGMPMIDPDLPDGLDDLWEMQQKQRAMKHMMAANPGLAGQMAANPGLARQMAANPGLAGQMGAPITNPNRLQGSQYSGPLQRKDTGGPGSVRIWTNPNTTDNLRGPNRGPYHQGNGPLRRNFEENSVKKDKIMPLRPSSFGDVSNKLITNHMSNEQKKDLIGLTTAKPLPNVHQNVQPHPYLQSVSGAQTKTTHVETGNYRNRWYRKRGRDNKITDATTLPPRPVSPTEDPSAVWNVQHLQPTYSYGEDIHQRYRSNDMGQQQTQQIQYERGPSNHNLPQTYKDTDNEHHQNKVNYNMQQNGQNYYQQNVPKDSTQSQSNSKVASAWDPRQLPQMSEIQDNVPQQHRNQPTESKHMPQMSEYQYSNTQYNPRQQQEMEDYQRFLNQQRGQHVGQVGDKRNIYPTNDENQINQRHVNNWQSPSRSEFEENEGKSTQRERIPSRINSETRSKTRNIISQLDLSKFKSSDPTRSVKPSQQTQSIEISHQTKWTGNQVEHEREREQETERENENSALRNSPAYGPTSRNGPINRSKLQQMVRERMRQNGALPWSPVREGGNRYNTHQGQIYPTEQALVEATLVHNRSKLAGDKGEITFSAGTSDPRLLHVSPKIPGSQGHMTGTHDLRTMQPSITGRGFWNNKTRIPPITGREVWIDPANQKEIAAAELSPAIISDIVDSFLLGGGDEIETPFGKIEREESGGYEIEGPLFRMILREIYESIHNENISSTTGKELEHQRKLRGFDLSAKKTSFPNTQRTIITGKSTLTNTNGINEQHRSIWDSLQIADKPSTKAPPQSDNNGQQLRVPDVSSNTGRPWEPVAQKAQNIPAPPWEPVAPMAPNKTALEAKIETTSQPVQKTKRIIEKVASTTTMATPTTTSATIATPKTSEMSYSSTTQQVVKLALPRVPTTTWKQLLSDEPISLNKKPPVAARMIWIPEEQGTVGNNTYKEKEIEKVIKREPPSDSAFGVMIVIIVVIAILVAPAFCIVWRIRKHLNEKKLKKILDDSDIKSVTETMISHDFGKCEDFEKERGARRKTYNRDYNSSDKTYHELQPLKSASGWTSPTVIVHQVNEIY